jgi:hypothetical protein
MAKKHQNMELIEITNIADCSTVTPPLQGVCVGVGVWGTPCTHTQLGVAGGAARSWKVKMEAQQIGEWILTLRNVKFEWRNYKLTRKVKLKRKGRNSFYLSHNGQRFSFGGEYQAIRKQYPKLLARVEQAIIGENVNDQET